MKIHKSQSSTFIYILILFFICILSFLIINTPGIRGDIEQSLRIFFKQPVLLKSESIKKNKTFDYLYKIYNSIQNKYTNFNSDIKKINIHIPFEGVQILREDRKEALKIGKLIAKRKINGYIIFENKKYNAEFRLKGDYFDHWRNIKQWSLRVQLKKNKAIEGMNEFSLTVHSARGFPYNYVIYDVLKKYNVLTPSYKDFRVKFNGENWGVMLAEEQMSKTFYAFNQIKEAPIFKMTNEEDLDLYRKHGNLSNIGDIIKWQGKLESKIYNEKKIKKQTNIPFEKTNYDLISLFASIQEILLTGDEQSKKQILNYLNIEKFAEARAITLIFGDVHSVDKINSRYYINPYNLKIEPILTDFHASYLENQFEKEEILSIQIYHLLKNNITYQERFNEVLIELSKKIENFKIVISEACKPYGKNCLNTYKDDLIKKNLNLLLSNNDIFDKLEVKEVSNLNYENFDTSNNITDQKKIHFRAYDNGEIVFFNLTSEKLKLKKIKLISDDYSKDFVLNLNLNKSKFKKVLSKKINLNFNEKEFSKAVLEYSDNNKSFYIENEIENSEFSPENLLLKKNNFYKQFKINQNTYRITKGRYFVDQPIIIPEGNNLIIDAGANLFMKDDTYIEVRDGELKINGEKDLPVIIRSRDENKFWRGIYVFSENIKNTSQIKNTKIFNVNYFNNNKIKLTGAINLINSKYIVHNLQLVNSESEDAINIVNSNIDLKNIEILNAKSDAIDLDFTFGNIENIYLNNIGGDGIDLSGSNIRLNYLLAKNIKDKGISAGEQSTAKIENIEITDSKIGIASKDSSSVQGHNIDIINSELYDLTSYIKKNYFNGGIIEITNIKKKNFKKFLVQKRSTLIVDGYKIKPLKFDIKQLY